MPPHGSVFPFSISFKYFILNAFNLNNAYSSPKINNKCTFSKRVIAPQDNPIMALEELEEHDFDANLDIFYLGDKVDVEEIPPKDSQNMLKHHEMIRSKVNESEDINLEPIRKPGWIR